MTRRMLVDATHSEETRVAVIDDSNGRMIEFDYESKFRKPLKGSIFLAKVTRVEPSLQAAFVNFGGNRHGFLPFSEIHPDYYRIPVSDREALIAEQEELLRQQEEENEAEEEAQAKEIAESGEGDDASDTVSGDDNVDVIDDPDDIEELSGEAGSLGDEDDDSEAAVQAEEKPKAKSKRKTKSKKDETKDASDDSQGADNQEADDQENSDDASDDQDHAEESDVDGNIQSSDSEDENDEKSQKPGNNNRYRGGRGRGRRGRNNGGRNNRRSAHSSRRVEILGGTEYEDDDNESDRFRFNLRRKYKIQEVIKRGQIMLIQVSREERGNKGAAVTSYLSLPGRYGVLMPNSPRSGGVSRKISNYKDRARMRSILKELDVSKGMSVILRTAGVTRTKVEIKRDVDYLTRLWNDIRELTLQSSAPALIYEEADLIKRAVRDLYTREVNEIIVSGDEGYKQAKKFMKMMIPSHAKRVKDYKDDIVPLFHKYKVENQITEIGETNAKLKSGGYLVINPTEALVSIDVNSGRATKERHIEETALNTNMEAAEEVARQLRLRDLGGLVVIDFIDMEDRRNNAKVERKLRDSLAMDRARIQLGRISSFGLLEMSRQRLNPSLTEAQFEQCDHCNGRGVVRTCDAIVIMLLRALEEEGIRKRAAELIVHVSSDVAVYILNHKRDNMRHIEERYGFRVLIRSDESVRAEGYRIEVSKPVDGYKSADTQQDNSSNDDEEDDKKSSKSSRRRGRRGGKGRNSRNRDDDDNQSSPQDQESSSHDHSSENKDEPKADQKPEQKKPSNRSKPKKDQEDAPKDKAPTDDEKPSKAKPKGGRGKKSSDDDNAKEAPREAAKSSSKADADAKGADEAAQPASPSNDSAPAEKPAPKKTEKALAEDKKEFETVNKAPQKKKKGWWGRS